MDFTDYIKMVPYFSQLVGEPPRSFISLRQSSFQQQFSHRPLLTQKLLYIYYTLFSDAQFPVSTDTYKGLLSFALNKKLQMWTV